jgi:hypothetical protein
MKRLILAVSAFAALAILGSSAKADPWGHDRLHDDLDHRAYHRALDHREAHRYPMTGWQHRQLHNDLRHEAYHDRLDHRLYHQSYGPYRYYGPRQSFGYSGPGFSIQFSR